MAAVAHIRDSHSAPNRELAFDAHVLAKALHHSDRDRHIFALSLLLAPRRGLAALRQNERALFGLGWRQTHRPLSRSRRCGQDTSPVRPSFLAIGDPSASTSLLGSHDTLAIDHQRRRSPSCSRRFANGHLSGSPFTSWRRSSLATLRIGSPLRSTRASRSPTRTTRRRARLALTP